MDGRAGVSDAVLASGEFAKVASGAGTGVVEEAEDDAACGLVIDRDAELVARSGRGDGNEGRKEKKKRGAECQGGGEWEAK